MLRFAASRLTTSFTLQQAACGPSFITRDYARRIPTRFQDASKKVDNVLPPGYALRRKGGPYLFAIVPQGEQWILETFGKFSRVLEPGFHPLIPFVQRVSFKHSMKELTFIIHRQQAITRDNVTLDIDGICYCRVNDCKRASYEIEQPFFAITNLAQTTMRSEIGKITLDQTFEERANLNHAIVNSIAGAADHWGVTVERYEIRDITVPDNIRNAMELEAEAERRKRQQILNSEAQRTAAVNVSEGEREAKRLQSEGEMLMQQNLAKGEAFAIERRATAQAEAIRSVASAIQEDGQDAVVFQLAREYIRAYRQIAKKSNTLIVPADHNDVSGTVAKAMTIYNTLRDQNPGLGLVDDDGGIEGLLSDSDDALEMARDVLVDLLDDQVD